MKYGALDKIISLKPKYATRSATDIKWNKMVCKCHIT